MTDLFYLELVEEFKECRGIVGKENQFRELQIKTGMVVGRDD